MFKKKDYNSQSNAKPDQEEEVLEGEFVDKASSHTTIEPTSKKAELIISGGSIIDRLAQTFLKDKPKLKTSVSMLIKSISFGVANASNGSDNSMSEVVQSSEQSLKKMFAALNKDEDNKKSSP